MTFRPFAVLRRAGTTLAAAPVPAIVTAGTVAVSVFLFGLVWLAGENLSAALGGWTGEAEHVTVYAKQNLPTAKVEALAGELAGLGGVVRVRTIPPAQGLAELRRTLGSAADVFEGVEAEAAIPTAFAVTLTGAATEKEPLEALAEKVRALEGVDAVDADWFWLERWERLVTVGRTAALAFAVVLGLGASLVVANASRIAALTRKEEIEILRLVGASDGFVLAPFVLEGILVGAVGSLVGLGALGTLYAVLVHGLDAATLVAPLPIEPRFLGAAPLALLAAAGPTLGALGNFASARRFLSEVPL